MLRKLSTHEHARIFKQRLDTTNPRYEEFKKKFRNLTLIEMQFRRGEYASTSALQEDIDEMLYCQMCMTMAAGSGDYDKAEEFQIFFNEQFEALQLKDLPLTVSSGKAGGDKSSK